MSDSMIMTVVAKEAIEESKASALPPTETDHSKTDSAVEAVTTTETKQLEIDPKTLQDDNTQRTSGGKATAHKKGSSHKKVGYLSTIQKQRVDSAFLSMFGYSWGTMPIVESSRCHDRRYILLKHIFGRRSAAQILHNTTSAPKSNQSDSCSNDAAVSQTKLVPAHMETTMRPLKNQKVGTASSMSQKDKTDPADSSNIERTGSYVALKGHGSSAAGRDGVDALLQQMHGPKNTSTIMKTAMDWESFKEEAGALGEKLEQHAESKGAYLKQQDFLTRVDHRQFEQERQAREQSRARQS